MAESTLSLTRDELLRAIGRYLGMDPTPGNWSASEVVTGNDILGIGLRQFYSPPILPNERSAHSWSFLRPTLTLGLVANQGEYDLPDLFGGFVERLYFTSGDTVGQPITITGVGEILHLRQGDGVTALTGFPQKAAVDQIPSDGTLGQRFSLMFWPVPDSNYTVAGPYYINPYLVTSSLTYPLGGQPHAETLRESCLAAAELEVNGERGNHMAKFLERLAASVSIDRRMGPKTFGYNGDPSMARGKFDRRELVNNNGLATYEGSTWE